MQLSIPFFLLCGCVLERYPLLYHVPIVDLDPGASHERAFGNTKEPASRSAGRDVQSSDRLHSRHVRFVADIERSPSNVRFWGQSGPHN
jgi:hypothetical protein